MNCGEFIEHQNIENGHDLCFDNENQLDQDFAGDGVGKLIDLGVDFLGRNGLELGQQFIENGYSWFFDEDNGLSRSITENGISTLYDWGAGFLSLGNSFELGRMFTTDMEVMGRILNTSALISLQMFVLAIFGVIVGFMRVATTVFANNLGFTNEIPFDGADITFLTRMFPNAVGHIEEIVNR